MHSLAPIPGQGYNRTTRNLLSRLSVGRGSEGPPFAHGPKYHEARPLWRPLRRRLFVASSFRGPLSCPGWLETPRELGGMMAERDDLVIRIAGEAGEGVLSTGQLITLAAARAGYGVLTDSVPPAEIKGG